MATVWLETLRELAVRLNPLCSRWWTGLAVVGTTASCSKSSVHLFISCSDIMFAKFLKKTDGYTDLDLADPFKYPTGGGGHVCLLWCSETQKKHSDVPLLTNVV